MLLLRPSPGACVDRQTILRLKIENSARRGVDAMQFEEEDRALQLYLEQNWFSSSNRDWRGEFEKHSSALLQVNRALWNLEDEIRCLQSLSVEKRGEKIERIVSIAFEIPRLNDERARLVETINAMFGLTAPEKLYPLQGSREKKEQNGAGTN